MSINKISILFGESPDFYVINDNVDKNQLIKELNLKEIIIESDNLIKELDKINTKKKECFNNNEYESGCRYRDKELMLLDRYIHFDYESNYSTSTIIDETMVYMFLNVKN